MTEREFFVDGIWVRDTQMYQKCQWNKEIKEERGVIIGVDDNQEWMLEWWWENYKEHNSLPVLFADFGMSERWKRWCKDRGHLSDLITLEGHPWFRKPFGCLATCFRQSLWLDTDVEVRKNIEPLFEYAADNSIGATFDRGSPPQWAAALPKDCRLYNSGIIAYNHGDIVFPKWALMVMIMCPFEPVKGKIKIPTGDQEVLALSIFQYGQGRVKEMPRDEVRLRLEHDKILYGDCLVKHWTGPHGKTEIRKRLPSLSLQQKQHIIASLPENGKMLHLRPNGDCIWFANHLQGEQTLMMDARDGDAAITTLEVLKQSGLAARVKTAQIVDQTIKHYDLVVCDVEDEKAFSAHMKQGAWLFTQNGKQLTGKRVGYGDLV